MDSVISGISIGEALTPLVEKASAAFPAPMLRLYGKWLTGNSACVALALRSHCQTLLADIVLVEGPVTKSDRSPEGRRPENTTWHFIPTSLGAIGAIVRNVRKVSEKVYKFRSETSAELSGDPSERLFDVPKPVNAQDVVFAIERTRMTKKKPASLGIKILIGNIDHGNRTIRVEHEIKLFAEELRFSTAAVNIEAIATVPITSKNKKAHKSEE